MSVRAVAEPLAQSPGQLRAWGSLCCWLHSAQTEQLMLHHYLQLVLNHKESISAKDKGYQSEHTHLRMGKKMLLFAVNVCKWKTNGLGPCTDLWNSHRIALIDLSLLKI